MHNWKRPASIKVSFVAHYMSSIVEMLSKCEKFWYQSIIRKGNSVPLELFMLFNFLQQESSCFATKMSNFRTFEKI